MPLLALAAWRAEGVRRALWLLFGLAAAVAVLPRAGAVVTAVLRGGAYVFREGTGAPADAFADGGFLFYPPEFLRLVGESQPLVNGWGSFLRAVRELSPGVLLVPLAVLAWLRPFARRFRAGLPPRAAARFLAALFAAVVLAMSIPQRRNVYYLAGFAALALAWSLARIAPRRIPPRFRTLAPAALVASLVVLPGAGPLGRSFAFADGPGYDLLDLMARLKALDPPPVDAARVPSPAPGAIAGVMPPWSMGHFVTALVGRPSAADPFFYGWRRQCRLFTATDDAEALAILSAARCRYLVTTDLTPLLPDYAAAAGRPAAPTVRMFARRVHESDASSPAPFLERVLDSRTGTRRADGTFQPRFRVFRVLGTAAP